MTKETIGLILIVSFDIIRRATDTTSYTHDSEGAVTGLTTTTAGSAFVQRETIGYDAAGMTTQYKVNVNEPLGVCFPRPMTFKSDSTKDWRYRHGAGGLREQRRLYYSPKGDSCNCLHEWTYYLRGAGDEVRAVWTGRQTADIDTCGNTGRRVVYYPVEYKSAGGADYTRDTNGTWRKEFRIGDYQGSIRTIVRAAGNTNYNYTPYGAQTVNDDRWSYLGQEKDKETAGLNEFDYRKYNSQTGSFLRPDPLWSLAPGVSSYVYGNSSPLVYSDPSGLFVQRIITGIDDDGLVHITEYDMSNPLDPSNRTYSTMRGGGGAASGSGPLKFGEQSYDSDGFGDFRGGSSSAGGSGNNGKIKDYSKPGQNTDGLTPSNNVHEPTGPGVYQRGSPGTPRKTNLEGARRGQAPRRNGRFGGGAMDAEGAEDSELDVFSQTKKRNAEVFFSSPAPLPKTPYTSRNFRKNLAKLTGQNPVGAQAHHAFPQSKEFAAFFKSRGIDVHNPTYGSWWGTPGHPQNASQYNAQWRQFISANPNASASEVFGFGRQMMLQFGQNINF